MIISMLLCIVILAFSCGSLRRDLNGTKAKLEMLIDMWDREQKEKAKGEA